MPSVLTGFEYDIFISYRQKDNKYDGWVTEFVDHLRRELEATFKEDVSIYFDVDPHDGLLETHNVDKSLETKLKCLIFVPIISQTYCDSKSFAWQHEFVAFNNLAKEDRFGRDIRLVGGNVASRILPVKIHSLDQEDKSLLENELGGVLRAIEFIYKESGVNRPLKPTDDKKDNLNKTYYRDQINKVANAIKEIISGLKSKPTSPSEEKTPHMESFGLVKKEVSKSKGDKPKNRKARIGIVSILALALVILGYLFIPKIFTPAGPDGKSIAVLPFLNLSNDPEQEYFSDGMVDEILDRLVKVGDMKVTSRTSSMQYKNSKTPLKIIARELGVSAILEGSVRKIGNTVRITAQLIDAKTGFHLWSEKYDRDLSDIFSIQSEVAQNVARELKATLTAKETDRMKTAPPTSSQLAYNYYLKGNEYKAKTDHYHALDLYSKAIIEDPLFAAAYAKRAQVHLSIFWYREEGWQGHELKAREDINKGLQLNPELAELKFAKAVAYYYLDRDYNNALKILHELKSEAPGRADLYSYISYIFRRQGKWQEATGEQKQAIQLDPLNEANITDLSETYGIMHQYDNQIECCRRGLTLIPDAKGLKVGIYSGFLNKTGDLKIAMKESGLKEEDDQKEFYYLTRQYDKLLNYLNLLGQSADTGWFINPYRFKNSQFGYSPKLFNYTLIYYLSGNKLLCKLYADSSITHLKEKLKEAPNDDRFYATLGKCYAIVGNPEEAIACGKKAVELKSFKLDATQGLVKELDLTVIYIITGHYDLVLDKIEYSLPIPGALTLGMLMLDPIYDKLRSLPRFQKIIDSSKIKTVVK